MRQMTVNVDNVAAAGLATASCLWADTRVELADFTDRLAVPCTSDAAWVGERHRTRAILMGAIPVRACDTPRLIRAALHRTEVA
ncbi:MAG: hypothetical protein GEV09_23320 [Pseudonocardiaceae bacterium]|nr:hypothetical protein [Pseudonocardiaceae bacterium]